jgi:hypothetical protein
MYFLVLFYHVTKNELKPFNPMSKFLCIKLVIMFAFWQGIVMAFLGWLGVLNEENVHLGKDWQSEEEIGMLVIPRVLSARAVRAARAVCALCAVCGVCAAYD